MTLERHCLRSPSFAQTASLMTLAAVLATGCGTGTECDTYYRDRDKDGFGAVGTGRFTCSQPRNFVTNNRDCDDGDENATPTGTFEGNLIIDGNDEGDLQAFIDACPGTVAGNVSISNTSRTDVDFLHSLSTVEGTLTIVNNDQLSDIGPLQNLTELGGLALQLNQGIRDLDELENLERVGSLRISVLLTDEENSLEVLSDIEGINDLAINVVGVNDYTGLPELTELSGDVLLGGPSITSLAGVESIETVGGTLTITNFRNDVDFSTMALRSVGNFLRVNDNDGLVTLDLPNLTSVGAGGLDIRNNGSLVTLDVSSATTTGNIVFNSNARIATIETAFTEATDIDLTNLPELTDISGLGTLDDVALEGLIIRNTGLTSLEGLEGISSVTGNVQVVGNADLGTMAGLDGLADVAGLVQIVNNEGLTALTGLGTLDTTAVGLEISDNPGLTSLEGLGGLVDAGNLTISGNLGLTSLDGVDALTTVEALLVEANGNLRSIAGLNGITTATTATFRSNPALSSADVDEWCALVQPTGPCTNEGNAP